MPDLSKYSLRKLTAEDLPVVLSWRNSQRIRDNMYNNHLIEEKEHRAWFEKINKGEFSDYLILDYDRKPAGMSYFDLDENFSDACTWGFYLGTLDLPAGSGTVMGYLSLNRIFTNPSIDAVTGECFEFNVASRKLFMRLGFTEGQIVNRRIKARNDQMFKIVPFSIKKEFWENGHKRIVENSFLQIREIAEAT